MKHRKGPASPSNIPAATWARLANIRRNSGRGREAGDSGLRAPLRRAAATGRRGDTVIAHLTPGERVVPAGVLAPELEARLDAAFQAAGLDPGRYRVGGADDSRNPVTGAREFFLEGGEGEVSPDYSFLGGVDPDPSGILDEAEAEAADIAASTSNPGGIDLGYGGPPGAGNNSTFNSSVSTPTTNTPYDGENIDGRPGRDAAGRQGSLTGSVSGSARSDRFGTLLGANQPAATRQAGGKFLGPADAPRGIDPFNIFRGPAAPGPGFSGQIGTPGGKSSPGQAAPSFAGPQAQTATVGPPAGATAVAPGPGASAVAGAAGLNIGRNGSIIDSQPGSLAEKADAWRQDIKDRWQELEARTADGDVLGYLTAKAAPETAPPAPLGPAAQAELEESLNLLFGPPETLPEAPGPAIPTATALTRSTELTPAQARLAEQEGLNRAGVNLPLTEEEDAALVKTAEFLEAAKTRGGLVQAEADALVGGLVPGTNAFQQAVTMGNAARDIPRRFGVKQKDGPAQLIPLPPPTDKRVNLEEMHRALDYKKERLGDLTNLLHPGEIRSLNSLKEEAFQKTSELFPGRDDVNNEVDAFRHAYWSFRMAQELGKDSAKRVGDGHERTPIGTYSGSVSKSSEGSTLMDIYNNRIGRDLFEETKEKYPEKAAGIVLDALRSGRLQVQPFNVLR